MNLHAQRRSKDEIGNTARATCRRTTAVVGAGLLVTMFVSGFAHTRTSLTGASSSTAATSTASGEGRVDLALPTFSDPTTITNPLFPISDLAQVIQLGHDDGGSLRHEVTLLPRTKTILWKGRKIETLVSQFVAYQNGRVLEVAVDFFAQADDGSVWYFGENVDNYANGVIADHEGSWLAGRDGPPGMIMPADPQVGDVYRPENIPGLVFEEVTVKATDRTVQGPRGPVEGAIRVQERLLDGTTESKFYAPGYGEFSAVHRAEGELVTVALAVPIDALSGPLPAELDTLSRGAARIFHATASGDWSAIAATLDSMTAAWNDYRSENVPALLDARLSRGMRLLERAVARERTSAARRASIAVTDASLDLHLRYRPVAEVDLDRLDRWGRRLLIDTAADDRPAIAGDIAVLETIWDRIAAP